MNEKHVIQPPTNREQRVLRVMIIIGLLSQFNFFYWFLQPELIEDYVLFCLLAAVIAFDSLRIIYIWYHYWHISIPEKPTLTKKISVDVLTTYFPGEPYEMVKETLIAITRMNYPHTAYLCDEANDPILESFCKKHGIVHVTRDNRKDAKAGNINNALLQATGDVCLILDPDHVPMVNFLDEVVPYFQNENIGFVQTVQSYYNIKESYVSNGAAQQTFLFYGPIMMCMNSYGTVNAIGANCVFRREALNSIGGHAAGLSEDMHTTMQLYAKGWESVYVPRVLTKGLAPSSLTAYYKQQLKWSRGTLDLLTTVYPKLFKNFTVRQKIHFGILPLFYMSGIFLLIGFLIPIISLCTATLPWKGNMVNFGLIYLPVFISILGIRVYIQRWVMNKEERGIYLIGGVLMICTWWIHLTGFIYTLIRKKVPYLPTPKEDKEATDWKVLIPNIVIAVISLFAIIYGLSIDLTPFSIFMAGFALLNICFMGSTFILAYQKRTPVKLDAFKNKGDYSKTYRNTSFKISRKLALPIMISVILFCGTLQYYSDYSAWDGVMSHVEDKNTINYMGIFAPEFDNGITSLKNVEEVSQHLDEDFDIISLYVPWKKDKDSIIPLQLLDSIYQREYLPMITWEPWLNSFQNDKGVDDNHVYDLIGNGYFDDYISGFADTVKKFQKPIFLRFAHEFDNPFYPWYVKEGNTALKFKKAWIHTYEIFKKRNAHNVIWIWNPWKPEHVSSFYPGEEYVDWIGVNILNYGILNQDGQWHEFEDIYKPFHEEFKKLPKTPIIISEFGSLKNKGHSQTKWLNNAFTAIQDKFKDIKSVIYFNSDLDNNLPLYVQNNQNLDWSISSKSTLRSAFVNKEVPDYVFKDLPATNQKILKEQKQGLQLLNICGINIKKGHNWKKDYHVLNRNNLSFDFTNLNSLGINTIKFQENNTYDYNVLNISKEFNLNVAYSFWVPENLDFVKDSLNTKLLASEILEKIRAHKNSSNIISWHIENDVQYNQKNFYHKPELFYQNSAYIKWLADLVRDIKKIDTLRPIVVDVEINKLSIYNLKRIISNVDGLDALGLVVKDDTYLDSVTSYLQGHDIMFIFSEIDVETFVNYGLSDANIPYFIASWQDQHESNKLVFNGLVDRKGRYKKRYYQLWNELKDNQKKELPPVVKILKPSKLVHDHQNFRYYAMIYDDKKNWTFASDTDGYTFEWALIKCDAYGNHLAIKEIGNNAHLDLEIPENNKLYRLQLTIIKDEAISTTMTILTTPLDLP
ncbi:glycosyltransferase family 2 protein [Changchengzhania lutea]|uniref:glycosyltransferase family 2 protein n=1 Tax=Changchengzhania lutea TaxID=2049305 RepID=UPI00163D675A|nr:glycosyltransferase family 2 protein [Changchengzhania lutea]